MRKIEQQMLDAINGGYNWSLGNTRVHAVIGGMEIQLHGNIIATVDDYGVRVNKATLAKWPTPTTKSRLKALGVDVFTRKGVTYLNGMEV